MSKRAGWWVACAAVISACSGHSATVGGNNDFAVAPLVDGSTLDAAVTDAGSGADLTRAGDGSINVDVSAPAIACGDTLVTVYQTPTNLPAMSAATRGDVLRCAFDSTLPLATVQSEVTAKGIATAMNTGVTLYRIEYRTERGDGSAGASTARVYLPSTPLPLPLPVIVIGHPTDGLAASCAPSSDPTSNQDLALPWAGLGYAVIVPDYAGLGNEGVQSYLDNHDQAYSLLDGARALRKLLPAPALSTQILAIGHSQGGGAVLSAQALAKAYGADGTLSAAIVFAPEWPTRLNSFGFVDELNNPSQLTILTGISEDVVTVMRTYAYFYNHVGPSDVGDGFPAAKSSGIDNAVNTLCQTPLGGYLQGVAPHVGDVFDPTLSMTLLACINGGATASGCVDPGLSFYNFLMQNFVTADSTGAPVLYIQGLADVIMPPASEAACNIAKLEADGVTPQVCVDAAAQHTTVVGRDTDFAIKWATALLAQEALPTCSSAGMPACTP